MTKSFIDRVKNIITSRQNDYAPPSKNHQVTADLLSTWFSARWGQKVIFTPEDVIMINDLQKTSRLANGFHEDSWLDKIGYAENVSMLNEEQLNKLFRPANDSSKK